MYLACIYIPREMNTQNIDQTKNDDFSAYFVSFALRTLQPNENFNAPATPSTKQWKGRRARQSLRIDSTPKSLKSKKIPLSLHQLHQQRGRPMASLRLA